MVAAGLPARAGTPPTGPRVAVSEAAATLPTPAELPPGTITSFSETTVTKPTGVRPCNLTTATPLALHDNGAAIGVYTTPATSSVFDLAQWVVSTRVFASTDTAHAAVARLAKAEKACPGLTKVKEDGVTTTYDRTWNARYVTPSGWHGWHSVDVITISGRKYGLRHISVFLQRGNALIQVDEIATVVGHNSAQQESRRLVVQQGLAARVALAAAS
ncbi:hypothetical protein acdb102_34160 [Acidothermaceae bacterium B102]|nr:hypothetical protein acdb102_34160 [Acidothermaceae bacterium B102]